LPGILEAHRRSRAAATMVLLPMPAGRSYGAVEVDPGGAVRRISGLGTAEQGLAPWHFSGVHVLSRAVFEAMRPSGPEGIHREVFRRRFAWGAVRGVVVDAGWSDLGSPATYLDAQGEVLAGRMEDPLLGNAGETRRPTPGPLLAPGARVHPSARLEPDV